MLSLDIKASIQKSVLCWLATADDAYPNVSPKEIFTHYKDKIIIANIASPTSAKNIKNNPQVCISFIDILVQKGWKIKGEARLLTNKDSKFEKYKVLLDKMTKGMFPFTSIMEITPAECKEVVSPSYLLYPDKTTEASQIESAKKIYGLE
jgi:predicted pyridoxine 5'-phosphate oxidase superfamily flavin-nucleotide-binding protein